MSEEPGLFHMDGQDGQDVNATKPSRDTNSTKRCALGARGRRLGIGKRALPSLLAPGPRIPALNASKPSCESSPSMFVPIASALTGDGIHMDGQDGQDVNASKPFCDTNSTKRCALGLGAGG